MYKFILIIFLLLVARSTRAQSEEYIYTDTAIIDKSNDEYEPVNSFKPSSDLPTDTLANINFREISWDTINGIRKSKDFAYMNTLDSLLHAKEKIQNPVNESPGFWYRFFNSSFLKIILWALAIFFIGFIIYQVFLKNFVFNRRNKKFLVQPEASEEYIPPGDFDTMLSEAKTNENYRLALRCWFLITIRTLSEADLVQFDVSQTNAEYAKQLRPGYALPFRELLRIYERSWYGKMPVSQEKFLLYEEKFKTFNSSIKR